MRAVLDACVLYPPTLRDLLLGVAAKGLYEPQWSDRILREWVLATAKLGPVAQAMAEGDAALARAAFPRASVREQPNIEARLSLPDPDDVHVLAVAIGGHADAIVTFNAVDFPRPVLAEAGIHGATRMGFCGSCGRAIRWRLGRWWPRSMPARRLWQASPCRCGPF